MIHINNPLGLRDKIKPPSMELDPIPLINILCIAFLLALTSSKFLFAPGINIDLPQSSNSTLLGHSSTASLSINQSNMIFFEGKLYNINTLEDALAQFVANTHASPPFTLLLKISKGTSMDTFFHICEMAQHAGFTNIQFAANPSTALQEFPPLSLL